MVVDMLSDSHPICSSTDVLMGFRLTASTGVHELQSLIELMGKLG